MLYILTKMVKKTIDGRWSGVSEIIAVGGKINRENMVDVMNEGAQQQSHNFVLLFSSSSSPKYEIAPPPTLMAVHTINKRPHEQRIVLDGTDNMGGHKEERDRVSAGEPRMHVSMHVPVCCNFFFRIGAIYIQCLLKQVEKNNAFSLSEDSCTSAGREVAPKHT